jgi:hypothetical protein
MERLVFSEMHSAMVVLQRWSFILFLFIKMASEEDGGGSSEHSPPEVLPTHESVKAM